MSKDFYLTKAPLFVPCDDAMSESPEQLETLQVSIPLSMTLIDLLHDFNATDGSLQKIKGLLGEIVQSPSYFFPDVPLVFDRNGLAAFVPDDNQSHKLNWEAFILQFHISLLTNLGYTGIAGNRGSSTRRTSSSIEDFDNAQRISSVSESHRGREESRRDYSTGSITMRQQNRCIASFKASVVQTGPSFESLQFSFAPPIARAANEPTETPAIQLEINSLVDVQISCSFDESPIFRSLVLAINAHGFLDRALGYVLTFELSQILQNIGIKAQCEINASQVFDDYYTCVLNVLFDHEVEIEIQNLLSEDRVGDVLDKLDNLKPYNLVPHSRDFLESILAPLCYHENFIFSQRATNIYTAVISEHPWDISNVEVITGDSQLSFDIGHDSVLLLCAPTKNGVYLTTFNSGKINYTPPTAGFYDWCIGRVNPNGDYDIEPASKCGRYIVLPANARKEIIHEMSAFDDRGVVPFDRLADQLPRLSTSGVTAIHLMGAIERNGLHRLVSETDHSIINKECGGVESLTQFCAKANSLGLRVIIDFTPLVSIKKSSRKYMPYQTLRAEEDGLYVTGHIPGSDLMLMNMRSPKYWDLLIQELTTLCDKTGISGFNFGDLEHWDYVYPRDMNELTRRDPDNQLHHYIQSIIEGSVIIQKPNTKTCGLISNQAKSSPFFIKLMSKLWSVRPDAFVWMKCESAYQPLVINSGIIPLNNGLTNIIQTAIAQSVHTNDFDSIKSASMFNEYFKNRDAMVPKGSLIITPFGSLTEGPFQMTAEAISLAIDSLFFLSDVPLLNGCLENALHLPSAYSVVIDPRARPKVWSPHVFKFAEILKNRAAIRSRADWALSGNVFPLPVSFNGKPMEPLVSYARIDPKTQKCAMFCTDFYADNIIFEVSIRDLPIFQNIEKDAIIEVKPLLVPQGTPSYYAMDEICNEGASLFLDINKYETSVYEITVMKPPVPTSITRILIEDVYVRLQRSIDFNTLSVLANNHIFNSILELLADDPTQEQVMKLVREMPNTQGIEKTFREALFFATRYNRNRNLLERINDDELVGEREKKVLIILDIMSSSKLDFIKDFGSSIIKVNKLGPIMFTAPELGPFSKVGGLSTMVWELAKELVGLGLDIHVVSPYYNVSPKGETDYLKKYGIKYMFKMDVYAPNKFEIGVHYGVVDGVKCWFIHHYSFFAAPYQTGSCSFRLQTLVVMAKAPLELCCQARLIPSLVITNDWMTGLTAAYARKTFGSVFNGTKFLHIFHNLGVGYAGKLWPSDGDTNSLHYIHQLPDELIVDPFDHSFDPSLCSLLCTDQWATVSKKYRDELLESSPYNYFLRRFPEPFAYSNGIRFQERLDALKKLGLTHIEAKRKVQQQFFGEVDDSKCLFFFIGRIVEQKGVFLIIDSFEELNRQYGGKMQFIVGGQAAPDDRAYGLPCTQRMWDLKSRYPKNFWADPSQFFSDGLLCCQAADYMLVPSLFEPSGIVQQEAFASGCPVLAFRTGGLADTVDEYNKEKKTGNGILFWSHRHRDFVWAMQRAYDLFQDQEEYEQLRKNAFNSVLSTEKVALAWAREFARLFNKIYEPNQNNQTYVPQIPDYAK